MEYTLVFPMEWRVDTDSRHQRCFEFSYSPWKTLRNLGPFRADASKLPVSASVEQRTLRHGLEFWPIIEYCYILLLACLAAQCSRLSASCLPSKAQVLFKGQHQHRTVPSCHPACFVRRVCAVSPGIVAGKRSTLH